MAVALKAVGALSLGTASVIATEIPASKAAGDLAVLFCVSGNGAIPDAPAGWTAINKIGVGSGGTDVGSVAIYCYRRVLDGSEGATVDAPRDNVHTQAGVVLFTGADPANPVTVSAGNTQTPASTTQATDSLPAKAGDSNDYFIAFAGHDRDSATNSARTSPDFVNLTGETITSIYNNSVNQSGGSGIYVDGGDPASDSSGAVSHTVTITSSIWAAMLLRINAAAAGAVDFTISNFSVGSPQIGNPAILVSHIFGINSFSVGSPTYGPVTATQRHALSIPAFSTGSPTFGPPTFAQKHSFTVANFATASPSIGTPSLGTTGNTALTIPSVDVGSPSIASPTLKQRHGLAISNFAVSSPAFGSVILTQRHGLTVPGFSTGSPELGTPAISEAGVAYALKQENILAADKQERVLEFARESRHQSADIEIRVLQ